jgi:hypothetical protein
MLFRLCADSPHRPTLDPLAAVTVAAYHDLDRTNDRERTTTRG